VKFIDRIDSYLSLINEQDPGAEAAPTADATAPDPSASQPAATGTQGVHVQDEGYVDLVKLLVKATAMNFPIGALDQLYQTDVTKENAFTVRDAVKDALTMYEGDGDNMTRLDNPNYKTFVDSINKNNLYLKLDKIKSIINSRA
jgi:hypothetical protein